MNEDQPDFSQWDPEALPCAYSPEGCFEGHFGTDEDYTGGDLIDDGTLPIGIIEIDPLDIIDSLAEPADMFIHVDHHSIDGETDVWLHADKVFDAMDGSGESDGSECDEDTCWYDESSGVEGESDWYSESSGNIGSSVEGSEWWDESSGFEASIGDGSDWEDSEEEDDECDWEDDFEGCCYPLYGEDACDYFTICVYAGDDE